MTKDLDAEIRRCTEIIKQSYDSLSIVSHATNSREYSQMDQSGDFTYIGVRHLVPKLWFTDPSHVPDVFCSELGRHVAMGEESFLVNILRSPSTAPFRFELKELPDIIRDFIGQGNDNPVVFAPIEFFATLAENEIMTFGWPHHIILDQRKIPLVYSSKYVQFKEFIIVDKSFGVWIYQRGNVDDRLTVEMRPTDDEDGNIDITVVTKVIYQKQNEKAIIYLSPQN